MHAHPIVNSVAVATFYEFEGNGWLEVDVADYNAVAALPEALTFMGREYGRTGWNSDRGRAYYSTGKKFAMGV